MFADVTAAQQLDDELESAIEGFELDPEDDALAEEPGEEAPGKTWSLSGSFEVDASYNYLDHDSNSGTDYGGLSQLRARGDLQFDWELAPGLRFYADGFAFFDFDYDLQGRHEFTDDVLDDYEFFADAPEFWLLAEIAPGLDLQIGRQIVNWGRSETLRVVDVLNPLDNREPGLVEIRDRRRGLAMVRAVYEWEQWTATALYIPEARVNLNPPFGSDFSPESLGEIAGLAPAFLLDTLSEDEPRDFTDAEYAASLRGVFPRWDISFHAARLNWNDPHLDLPEARFLTTAPTLLGDIQRNTRLAYSRVNMFGVGASVAEGDWLLKGEFAWLDGIDYSLASVLGTLVDTDTVKRTRRDTLVGLEYFGIEKTLVALEVVNRHVQNFDNAAEFFFAERNMWEVALRTTVDLMQDRMRVIVLLAALGDRADDTAFMRVQVDYDWNDQIETSVGWVVYEEGDTPHLRAFDRNDRLFLRMRYRF